MTAYNFKKQFADKVASGEKRQTIRQKRKQGNAQPGKMLQLYTGQRTKNCRLLREAECIVVVPIEIYDDDLVKVGDYILSDRQIKSLAKDDGFDCAADFVDFFEKQYGLPFEGLLIKW